MKDTTGAEFVAVDLHVHTPASGDYRDKKATARDLVEAAVAKGLGVLAITDHNSAEWIDPVRQAARGSDLTVIPGVEVTTPEGHILALFDTTQSADSIRDFLIRVGVPREQHGKEEAISKQHAEDVLRAIADMAGLGIAAHANTKGIGLLQQKGQYKLGVVPMPELRALEFTQKGDIEAFTRGSVPGYGAKACVQGSDSHALSEIGQRLTFIKTDDRSLYGIAQALQDYDIRVRFPWNLHSPEHPRILSLTVDQGFFDDQRFSFNPNLNCLVGGQGAGKSTVIELLRFCFDDVSTFQHVIDDHTGKLDKLVGAGGTVEVLYLDADGVTKRVRRQLQPWPTDREVRDLSGNEAELIAPPVFFSQGELVDVARSTTAQLDQIDRHLSLEEENETEVALANKLAINAAERFAVQQRITVLDGEITHPETGLAATHKKHGILQSKLSDPVLTTFPIWEAEQAYLNDLAKELDSLPDALENAIAEIDLSALDVEVPADAPNVKALSTVSKTHGAVERLAQKTCTDWRKGLATIRKDVQTTADQVRPAFSAQKAKHDALLKAIDQADIRKATAQFRQLGVRLEALKKQESEREKSATKLSKLHEARKKLLQDIRATRKARAGKRQAKAREFQNALPGIVEASVVPLGDRTILASALRDLSRGARIQEPDILAFASAFEPSQLSDLIASKDIAALTVGAKTSADVATRLVNECSKKGDAKIYELDVLSLPDLPILKYVIAPGRAKSINELSTGQKGTVIIALALVEGSGPLIVDHPEEPLDTKSIYSQVVTKLREGKDTRQFIFTTHNANIAVGADAELNHILGATADHGVIESSGGVDNARTNELLLLHLEGGPEALSHRVKKYRAPGKKSGGS